MDTSKAQISTTRPQTSSGFPGAPGTIFNDENTKPDLDLSHVDMDEEDEIVGAASQQQRVSIFITKLFTKI